MARTWIYSALPLALMAGLIAAFFAWKPLDYLSEGAPPTEAMVFEKVRLDGNGIHATIRAEGSAPVRIAQVLVDDAYWSFTRTPDGPLGRFETARIDIPYPWIEGETHVLKVITATGVTFEHEIAVAIASAGVRQGGMAGLVLIGLFVGPLPVLIGLLFFPAMRRASPVVVTFVLGLTVGLLGFLLIDTIAEGLEAGERALKGLNGEILFWGAALFALIGLFAVGRRGGNAPGPVRLAIMIAGGIGLHNLGEGLAIGAAMSTGEVALASFLVLGFALHNVTEGIGIAAPLTRERPPLWLFVALAALAGLPAVAGTLAGSYAYAPHWVAICFGLGAGAIAQVIFEVLGLLARRLGSTAALLQPANALGIVTGVVVMYATALLIPA